MENLDELPYQSPVFMFFSKSSNARPGLGQDESIHPTDLGKYDTLYSIHNWRQKLSNFYAKGLFEPLFTLDGLKWKSCEHYLHSQKFKESHPEYYFEFSLDSGSELSNAVGATVKKAGRKYKMTPDEINRWDNISASIIYQAQEAKFTQNDDLRNILILTQGALLKHRASRFGPLVTENRLMELRNFLIVRDTKDND